MELKEIDLIVVPGTQQHAQDFFFCNGDGDAVCQLADLRGCRSRDMREIFTLPTKNKAEHARYVSTAAVSSHCVGCTYRRSPRVRASETTKKDTGDHRGRLQLGFWLSQNRARRVLAGNQRGPTRRIHNNAQRYISGADWANGLVDTAAEGRRHCLVINWRSEQPHIEATRDSSTEAPEDGNLPVGAVQDLKQMVHHFKQARKRRFSPTPR